MEQILQTVAESRSPVQGESWPKLSKEYKEFKKEQLGSSSPDMELNGDMLNALTYRTTKDGVEIGFFGKEAAKADGHNKLSGRENHTPQRRFLPDQGEVFKKDIQSEVDNIISDAAVESDSYPASELKAITTKSELYDYFSEKLDLESRSEIRMTILRNEQLVSRLDKYDILDLL